MRTQSNPQDSKTVLQTKKKIQDFYELCNLSSNEAKRNPSEKTNHSKINQKGFDNHWESARSNHKDWIIKEPKTPTEGSTHTRPLDALRLGCEIDGKRQTPEGWRLENSQTRIKNSSNWKRRSKIQIQAQRACKQANWESWQAWRDCQAATRAIKVLARVVFEKHAPTGATVKGITALIKFVKSKIKMNSPQLDQQYIDRPSIQTDRPSIKI